MPAKPSREEKMSDTFFIMGAQYFALAEYCADAFYLPVAVTLFHHAIEMLLKGILARSKSSKELKALGHDLVALWQEFKGMAADPKLNRYDPTIMRLNDMELLRYPDTIVDKGFVLNVGRGTVGPMQMPGTEELPQYFVDVLPLEEIAVAIFVLGNVPVTPYFRNTPEAFLRTLASGLRPVNS
jgi:hypothetical protein